MRKDEAILSFTRKAIPEPGRRSLTINSQQRWLTNDDGVGEIKFDTFLIFIVAILFGCNSDGEPAQKDLVNSTTAGSQAIESNTVVPEKNTHTQTQTGDTSSYTFESDYDSIQGDQSESDANARSTDTQNPDAGSAIEDSTAIAAGTTGSFGQRNDDAQIVVGDARIDEPDASLLEDSGETVEKADSGENAEEVDSGSDATIQKPDVVCDSSEPKVRCGPFEICGGLTPFCFITFDTYGPVVYCGLVPLASSSTAIYRCDDSCDCPEGQICCDARWKGQPPLQGGRCADDCSTIPYGFQICRADEECPGQKVCRELGYPPGTYLMECVDP